MDPRTKEAVDNLVVEMVDAMKDAREHGEGLNYPAAASLAVAAAVDELDATVSRLVNELRKIREILDGR